MKDLKQVLKAYVTSRVEANRPTAVYLGDNDEILDVLGEEYDILDEPTFGCDVLVLDGDPEPFQKFLPDTELIIYVGPNVGPRQGFRNVMDWDKAARGYSAYMTPQKAFVYSSGAVVDMLSAASTSTTIPPTTTLPPPVEEEKVDPVPFKFRDPTDTPTTPTSPPWIMK